MLFRALRSAKGIKFGWILKRSGNFLSNEPKNVFVFKKEKKAQILATSQKLFICFQDCIEFKK